MATSLFIPDDEIGEAVSKALESGALVSIEDIAEAQIAAHGLVDIPTFHAFTETLPQPFYLRQAVACKGTVASSKEHLTEHCFFVSKGKCRVWSEKDGTQFIQAPYWGITKPGTKRFLLIDEDIIWTTFHPTNRTTVEAVESDIIKPHVNPLLESCPGPQLQQ